MTENDQFVAGDINNVDQYSDLRRAVSDGTLTSRSTVAREAENKRAFIGDTGQTTASDILRAVIANNSSDHLTVIYKLEWYNDGNSDYFGQIIRNPDTNVPTTEQNHVNLYSATDDSEKTSETSFTFGSGSATLSGEAVTGAEITFSQGDNTQDFLYFLEPGESVGVNVDTGGSLTDATVKFTIFYYEIPV